MSAVWLAWMDSRGRDAALRNTPGARHLGQHLGIFARRYACDHDAVHTFGQVRILVQLLIGTSRHFAAITTPQARAFDTQFALVEHDLASLRAVPADLAAPATRMLLGGDFGGGNHQQLLHQAATGFVHQLVGSCACSGSGRASAAGADCSRRNRPAVFVLLGDDVQRRVGPGGLLPGGRHVTVLLGSQSGKLVVETRFTRIPNGEPPPSTFNYVWEIAPRPAWGPLFEA